MAKSNITLWQELARELDGPSDYEIRAKALECTSLLFSSMDPSVSAAVFTEVLSANEKYLRNGTL